MVVICSRETLLLMYRGSCIMAIVKYISMLLRMCPNLNVMYVPSGQTSQLNFPNIKELNGKHFVSFFILF